MKITEIKLTPVTVPFTEPEVWSGGSRPGITSIIVEVSTSDGIVGIGEAVPAPTPEVTIACLRGIRNLLIGESPFDVERLVHKVNSVGGLYPFATMANSAIGGVEMALWDIVGKALGRPVHTFFGGLVRRHVSFMFFVQRKGLAEMAADAQRAVASGFRTIYTKVGLDYESDVAVVKALREAIGPNTRLRVDANEAWSPGTAVRILNEMAQYDLEYIEQPIAMRDVEHLKVLRSRTSVPIAANQTSWTNRDLYQVLAAGAVDIVMTDPHQAGGLLAFKKAAGIAEAAGVPIVFHSFGPLAITTYAAMQVIASSSNFILDNQTYNHMLADDVVRVPPVFNQGQLSLPDAPGIGVELDPEKVEKYARLYEQQGYFSAYNSEDEAFIRERKTADAKILWFPSQ